MSGMPSGEYRYRVRASNASGDSSFDYSNTVQVMTSGAGGGISGPSTDSDGTYTLTWSPDCSSSGTMYYLYENGQQVHGASCSYTGSYTTAYPGNVTGTYNYVLDYCDTLPPPESGSICASDLGMTQTHTVTVNIVVPGAPSISAPSVDADGSYTVSWSQPSNANRYVVERSTDGGQSWSTYSSTTSSTLAENVGSGGARFDYRVKACNAVCGSASSVATTLVSPPAPASISSSEGSVAYGTGDLTLTWSTSTGAQTYELQQKTASGSWTSAGTTGSTSLELVDNAGGSYSFRVRACYESACGDYSPTLNVLVVALENLSDPVAISAADSAGTMAYSTTVSRGGSAAIELPISAIPGVNGLSPALSLVYSSGGARSLVDARQESGLLGYGWRLRGLSAIRRCRVGSTGDVDMSTNDRLCLDGEPLMLVAGSSYWSSDAEYRTERQSMVRIFQRDTGGQVWFEAFLPNGGRVLYGDTTDATAIAFGATSPYLWSARLVEDDFGNQMTVSYYNDTFKGTNYPLRIDYAGAQLDFHYQMRTDTTALTYGSSGYITTNATRTVALNRIEVSMQGVPVREYRLDNQLDAGGSYLRLERVQLCGYDETGVSLSCLAPMSFDWTMDAGTSDEFVSAVSAVNDGVGARTEFDYTLIPATGTHVLDYNEQPFDEVASDPTAQPLPDGTPRRVVSELRRPDGLGGYQRTTYGYKGSPLYSTENRGFIGFAERRVDRLSVPEYDIDTGTTSNRTLTTFEAFEVVHPFLGKVSDRKQVFDGNVSSTSYLIAEEEVVRNQIDLGSGVSLPFVSARLSRSLEDGNSVSASAVYQGFCFKPLVGGTCPTTGASQEFPTQRHVERYVGPDLDASALTSVDLKVTRTTEFENDLTDGVVGFPVRNELTYDPLTGTPITRVSTRSRLAGTSATTNVTRFPGDLDLELQTALGYDALGNLTQTQVSGQDVGARVTQLASFDDGRYPQTITDAEFNSTSVLYDHRFGAAAAMTDADQNSDLFVYDEFGRLAAAQGPDGTLVTQEWDVCTGGVCSQVTWADAVMRVTVTTDNGATQVAPTERIYLDALGREVLRETEAFDSSDGWSRIETHYDAAGRVVRTSMPYFSAGGTATYVERRSDALGRTVYGDRPDGGKTTTDFAGATGSMTVTVTETVMTDGTSETQQKVSTFDTRGQLVSTTDAFGTSAAVTTSYDYNAAGDLIGVNVDGTEVASMQYNDAGMREQIDEINSGTTTYDVDALGRIRSQTDANGFTTTFDYDLLDRLTTRVDGVGTAGAVTSTWTWDPVNGVGRLGTRSIDGFTETIDYDALGRVDQTTTSVSVTGFAGNGSYVLDLDYDSAGRLASTTWPSGATFTNVYNARGYRSQVKQGSTVLETMASRDAFGHPTQTEFGNGVKTQRGYDGLGRLTSLATGPSTTPASLQDLEYAWRSNGSLYRRTDKRNTASSGDDWVETFDYDALNRLEAATTVKAGSHARLLNFGYDAVGNLTGKTSDVSGDLDVTGYAYNAASPHRLTAATIGGVATTFGYDAAGNITTYDAASGDDTAIAYNHRNQVETITVGPTAAPTAEDSFWYGPDGARFLKRSTWDDGGTTEASWTLYLMGGSYEATYPVSDSSVTSIEQVQVTAAVVHRRTVTPSGTTNAIAYQHRDHLGSISVVTDAAGNW